MKSALFLAAATAVAAQTTTTLVPDQPVTFLAYLYNSTSDCSGNSNYIYVDSNGGCINRPVTGEGSARISIMNTGSDFLTAWTEPDCTGTSIFVIANDSECDALGGTAAQSWSNDDRVFG
ncbi:hypothetical protein F5Y18DRAFT_424648 [Xylariaceae sp. FL1019]|nr:hypothetical protein F5Y18DRAFT_424648 [Xylariaceae sp. FL1019]